MIRAKALDGTRVELPATAVDSLRAGLRGTLCAPVDSGYDDARSIWNAMFDRHPALIARCLGTGDIAASIGFAREHDLPLAVKGGGHNIASLGVCDGGIVLDLSLLRGVWVDRHTQTARAQAGWRCSSGRSCASS
jgi:FAD/FMN-containing dehydrogenase